MASRRDEAPKTWFRSDRVFRVDGDWYIHTREGIAVGPYSDKFAADVDAEMLKSLLVGVSAVEATSLIEKFMRCSSTNLQGGKTAGAQVDAAEVASLLDDDDIEYSLDNIRQLS